MEKKPGYEASRISEGRWGVFYRVDEHTSFGPQGDIHRTKKAAERDAARRNWAEARIAEENATEGA